MYCNFLFLIWSHIFYAIAITDIISGFTELADVLTVRIDEEIVVVLYKVIILFKFPAVSPAVHTTELFVDNAVVYVIVKFPRLFLVTLDTFPEPFIVIAAGFVPAVLPSNLTHARIAYSGAFPGGAAKAAPPEPNAKIPARLVVPIPTFPLMMSELTGVTVFM